MLFLQLLACVGSVLQDYLRLQLFFKSVLYIALLLAWKVFLFLHLFWYIFHVHFQMVFVYFICLIALFSLIFLHLEPI